MAGLIFVAGTVAGVILFSRFLKRVADEGDAVYPPGEPVDPPIFDAGRFLGGEF